MDFDTFLNRIEQKLEQISLKYAGYTDILDADDLLSEMKLHLWESWGKGELKDKTDSYAVQSAYFFARNLMRKTRDAAKKMSIDEILDDGEAPLKDTIPDPNPGVFEITDGNRIVDKIMNNGFSPVEKIIVGMLCEGYTAREIGKKLHISHTMVIKHKNHMAEEVSRNYAYLLV